MAMDGMNVVTNCDGALQEVSGRSFYSQSAPPAMDRRTVSN
jgi:hypothetical protein